jgi:biopolymer transport protein ExbB/TolQ
VIAIPALFTHSYLEARAVGILSDIEAQILDFLHFVRRPPEVGEVEDDT